MKSKKIIAMIVAFAAFMAVATSGLAAATISTTTTYNTGSDYVEVAVDVRGATPDSEVTYLVESNDANVGIVYIDQKTATDGSVDFDYKILKSKITGLSTNVKFGTNGAIDVDETASSDATIELNNLFVTKNNSTVTLYSDINTQNALGENAVVGDGDTIYAKVVADEGYEVVKVTIGGVEATATDNGVYEIVGNKAIVVETKEQQVSVKEDSVVPSDGITFTENGNVDKDAEDIAAAEEAGNTVKTTLIKVVGTPKSVGVTVDGVEYPAYTGDGKAQNYTINGVYAVRIITDKGDAVIEAYAR